MASEQQERTIALPQDLATELERQAESEERPVSEVLSDALRAYRISRVRKMLDEDHAYVKTLPPTPYTEDDVERLVEEVRRELREERRGGAA